MDTSLLAKKAAPLIWFILLGMVAYTVWPHLLHDSGETSHHVIQAQAFLNGRLHIPSAMHDAVFARGHYYIIFPPFPVLLVLPMVALMGVTGSKVIVMGLLLSALNVFLLRRILVRLDIPRPVIPWILVAFFMGTGYWFCMLNSAWVYCFAHMVAVTCLLLAIHEAYSQGRGWLVGLYIGMAFLSRQMTLYSLVFFAWVLWDRYRDRSPKKALLQVAALLSVFGVALAVYLGLNWIRFGHPLDTGYTLLHSPLYLKPRMEQYGLFHPAYVLFNFIHFFLQGFHIEFSGDMHMQLEGLDLWGTALTMASPFVFFALAVPVRKNWVLGAWITVGLTILHALFYHNNGWIQLNTQRFTLDFLPILIVLVALGIKSLETQIWKWFIVYAVVLNIIALTLIPSVHR